MNLLTEVLKDNPGIKSVNGTRELAGLEIAKKYLTKLDGKRLHD